MRKNFYFLGLLILLITEIANAQHVDHNALARCGITKDFVQGLADPVRHSELRVKMSNALAARSTMIDCGRFRLVFEDEILGNGIGFNNPSNGLDYQNCACEVANYIQTVYDVPAGDGSQIEIFFNQSWDATLNPMPVGLNPMTLAVGGSLFSTSDFVANVPGFYGGNVYEHFTTGIDPDPTNIDGEITLNEDFTYHTCGTPAACAFDLKSVLLHEFMHVLGWMSSLEEDPGFIPQSIFGSNKYSKYDQYFLHAGNIHTGPLTHIVDATNPSAPFIDPSVPANILTSETVWLTSITEDTPGANQNSPIFGVHPAITYSDPPNTISHFSDYQDTHDKTAHWAPGFTPDYVMGPFFGWDQIRDKFTMQEMRSLNTMGYAYASTFLISTSINPPVLNSSVVGNKHAYTTKLIFDDAWYWVGPYGRSEVDMNVTTPPETTITNCANAVFDLSTNPDLIDPDGDPIRIFPGSLYNIRGCGIGGNNHDALSVNSVAGGDIITYTPRPDFIGRAQFGFNLYDGKEKGAFMIYTIDVTGCQPCVPNLIVNGNFEEGMEIKTFSNPFVDNSGLTYNRDNKYMGDNGSVIPDGVTFCNGNTSVVKQSWGCIPGAGTFGWYFQSFDPGLTPSGISTTGSRYYDMRYEVNNYFRLCSPAQNCTRYEVEFDYNSTAANVIDMGFTDTPVGDGSPIPLISPMMGVNLPSTGGVWQHMVIELNYCSSTSSGFFVMQNTIVPSIYLDNLDLHIDQTPPVFAASIIPSAPSVCPGNPVDLNSSFNNPLCPPVTYEWSNAGETTSSITVSPLVSTTYTVSVTDGCSTTTATTTITMATGSITAIASPPIIGPGGTSTLTTNATGAVWTPGGAGSSINVSPSVTTTYTVTGTDPVNGCIGTATVTVTVVPVCGGVPAGASVVPPAGDSSSSYPGGFTAVSSTIAINGTFFVNTNFSMSGISNVLMAPNTKIIILPGFTLTVTNCRLYSCDLIMWTGIEIQPGGKLIMTGSIIEDARTAVSSINNGGAGFPSDFDIFNSTFNRNYVGLKVANWPYSVVHPGIIRRILFHSQNSTTNTSNTPLLDAPFNSQSAETGIELFNVDSIIIGDSSSLSLQNRFRYLRTGIRAILSKYSVHNNDFRSNFTTPACFVPTPPPAGFVCPVNTIGWAIWNTRTTCTIGGYAPYKSNHFQALGNGVLHEAGEFLEVLKNNFWNITTPVTTVNSVAILTQGFSPGNMVIIKDNDFKGFEIGCWHRDNTESSYAVTNYSVSNNQFRQFTITGVFCLQNTLGIIDVKENAFSQLGPAAYSANTAIKIQNAGLPLASSPLVQIVQNTTVWVNNGIHLTEMKRPQILNNSITFKNTLDYMTAGATYSGIRAQKGDLEYIVQNTIKKPGANPAAVAEFRNYGIMIETNANITSVLENEVEKLGTGMLFFNYFNAGSMIRCNIMDVNRTGMILANVNVGNQGQLSPPIAPDNTWSDVSSMSGFLAVRGLFSPPPIDYYTRTATWPYCPSPTKIVPPLTIHTSSNFALPVVSTAAEGCSNICYGCFVMKMAKIARNEAPFDQVTDLNNRFTMHEGLINSILAGSVTLDPATTDGQDLQMFVDTSLTNTNVGRLIDVSMTASSGDVPLAEAKNDAIVPKECSDEYHKTVNAIYLKTWARHIFDIPLADYTTLVNIAVQNPMFCGTSVYDARVMTGIDVNDFSEPGHSMIEEEFTGTGVEDNVGMLYPNPASNVCTYEALLKDNEDGAIEMYDLSGKLLSSHKLSAGNNKLEIDLENYTNGVYLYRIFINGEMKDHKKLVIAK